LKSDKYIKFVDTALKLSENRKWITDKLKTEGLPENKLKMKPLCRNPLN
jgi:hypothetical protein